MKLVLAAFAISALATPVFAQTPGPSPAPPASAAPLAGQDGGDTGPGGVKALRASCRQEADNGGLRGPARREAVSACVVRQRPDLAAREQCRSDGFAKGLRKEELHAFVKTCLKPKG